MAQSRPLNSSGTSMNLMPRREFHARTTRLILTSALLLCVSFPAWAELGGDEASIQTDQAQMQGQRRIARASTHVMHEIQLPTGTKVREYVSPAGKVFAVAWEGPFLPNLQQVLGSYFQELGRAQANRRGRGPLIIQLPSLILYSGGHMRAFAGQAYVPDLVPQGVTAEAIK